MISDNVFASVFVNNLPSYIGEGFIVARQVDGELWYYGTYDTSERAKDVAIELGNGVFFEIR